MPETPEVVEPRAAAVHPAAGAGAGPGGDRGAVLVVAATHGNERNGAWLLGWGDTTAAAEGPAPAPGLPSGSGLLDRRLRIHSSCGNPAALLQDRRYLDRDLNRSFRRDLLADPACPDREVQRARALLQRHGPQGLDPCLVVVDLHSTTAAMGSCLVIYGRRPTDLALAAALQRRLGLPIYLHEADPSQTGYLAECWPAGVVIEVGPVPQGVLQAATVQATRLALQATIDVLAEARQGSLALPPELVLHRHLGSLDLPRADDGLPLAIVHPQRQNRDWQPLLPGDPLFLSRAGETLLYNPEQLQGLPNPVPLAGPVWPVFINEAAYREKGIALSLTLREIWPVQPAWRQELLQLAARLVAAP